MKRVWEEDYDVRSNGKRSKGWVHDRQPDWEDLEMMGGNEDADDEDEEEEFVLESRRRQHRLDRESESDRNDIPGAPYKERRRTSPCATRGRLLWPRAGDEAVVQVEDSQGKESQSDGESHTLEGSSACSSFVVADDSASVLEEEKVSERCLGRAVLEEFRQALKEKISRLQARLASVERELACPTPQESVVSSESEPEVLDERTCARRIDSDRLCVYPWEDEKWMNGSL